MTEPAALQPDDEHNRRLAEAVRPPGWTNPRPAGRYNLVVIGAGTAGLVTAAGAAGLGARAALIERELMGGDCLNVGCVPSKGMISAGRVAAAVREAGEFGVSVSGGPNVDFAAAMARMRRLRAGIAPNDSAKRFRDLGVDVYFGAARFVDRETVEVAGASLKFAKAVIATGARAMVPAIPGLTEVPYLTNETVFSLTELPRRLGVFGGGPIGCELAQAFAQLGARVVLVHSGVLPREDRDAAQIVEQALVRDGVQLRAGGKAAAVRKSPAGAILISGLAGDGSAEAEVDALLIAAGRAPNVQGLNLEAAGVQFDERQGVHVDDRLQTTNPRIYAAGDICSAFKFTHAADFLARIAIQNALFLGRKKASRLLIPWCTYTSPEVAHVGLSEQEAAKRGIRCDVYRQEFHDVDRAILDGESEGFVKVLTSRGKDRILGATIVARNAGDMISQLTQALQHRIGLGRLASVIHPYPTQAEAIRKIGDQYNRTRLTPWVKRAFGAWLNWTR